MIYYYFKTNPYEIKVRGHANSNYKGQDIVCASVSVATTLSAQLIYKFEQIDNVDIILEEGKFNLEVKKETKEIKVICENLIWVLQELEETYPNYIKHQKER